MRGGQLWVRLCRRGYCRRRQDGHRAKKLEGRHCVSPLEYAL